MGHFFFCYFYCGMNECRYIELFAAEIYRKRFPDDLFINDDICKVS